VNPPVEGVIWIEFPVSATKTPAPKVRDENQVSSHPRESNAIWTEFPVSGTKTTMPKAHGENWLSSHSRPGVPPLWYARQP
jgi:hypothetical protein